MTRSAAETLVALIALAERILTEPEMAFVHRDHVERLCEDVAEHLREGGHVNFTTAAVVACLYVTTDSGLDVSRRARRMVAARSARDLLQFVRGDLYEAMAARAALTGDGA